MNKQEIFDIALRKTIAQGEPSIDTSGTPRYKVLKDGKELRCAMGHVLNDEQLANVGNISGAEEIFTKDITDESEIKKMQNFVFSIQTAHDLAAQRSRGGELFVETFKKKMSDVATNFNLMFPSDIK